MALGSNRQATRLGNQVYLGTTALTIEDNAKLYCGEMIELLKSSNEVRPATAVSGCIVLGVGTQEIDNTDDGLTVSFIDQSILEMVNAGDITVDNIGDLCYVDDAITVSISGGVNVAGRVVDVPSSTRVFVDFHPSVKG